MIMGLGEQGFKILVPCSKYVREVSGFSAAFKCVLMVDFAMKSGENLCW